VAGESHEAITAKRTAAADAIVNSDADKRVIIAGPGTGKTFTFRKALEACGDRGLALTFIRTLVADLEQALGDIADVFTFHAFCKYQLHQHLPEGLEPGWHYYPPLLDLVVEDLARVGKPWTKNGIEHAMHRLDESDGSIREVLRVGNYFNAVAHMDVVYRGLRHFEDHPDDVPDYPLIVVDEYQDFSEMETSFIQLLAETNKVLIAGDDDQALYRFKGADPEFIRELARGDDYERFELPYCSRCPDVVVSAVNSVIEAAIANGNLAGRLDKDFECFVPDKEADNEAHPVIIAAKCSVQNNNSPYVGRYIVERIKTIPVADIEESRENGYPKVLVIGPDPFRSAAYNVIREAFPDAVHRKSEVVPVDPLAGYHLLAKDENSRLGWRIIIQCHRFDGWEDVLIEVTQDEAEIVDLLPDDYREQHLAIARLVGRLLDGEELDADEVAALEAALEIPMDAIRQQLNLATEMEQDSADEPVPTSADIADHDAASPSIICTSLTSSKGLSAGYVFIVGFNNGYLPRDPQAISDTEVCQFLVGLSRTRKECHVISVGNFAGNWLNDSEFASWIYAQTQGMTANKAYFEAA
jgi:superfamily I DNA/RNA helicase